MLQGISAWITSRYVLEFDHNTNIADIIIPSKWGSECCTVHQTEYPQAKIKIILHLTLEHKKLLPLSISATPDPITTFMKAIESNLKAIKS